MDTTIQTTQSTLFNINELIKLSARLDSLQLRLLVTLQILKHIHHATSSQELYNWLFDLVDLKVVNSEEPIDLTEEMRLTLSVVSPTINENGNEILNVDLDEKRQLMAVVAYMICFRSNPYLGQRFYDKVVISHDWEADYWCANRAFAFGDDDSNRPDGYYQAKTIEFWESLKKTDLISSLKGYFTGKSQAVADNIQEIIFGMISKLRTCPQTGIKMYLTDNRTNTPFLLTDKKYLLDPMMGIIGHATQKTENGRSDLYLNNASGTIWEVITASGKKIDIHPGKEMPVRSGMAISIPKEGLSWLVASNPSNEYSNI